ncbi:MAG: (Fe-S)-binding protein [Alphaproteobacteria bacterium]
MNVALFVTCLADLFRPQTAWATVRLLEHGGCTVSVPEAQSCCGQPGFNNGDTDSTIAIAKQVIESFEGYDHVVIPSGSCGGMISKHYPELFEAGTDWHKRACDLAAKTHELTDFLVNILQLSDLPGQAPDGPVTYHDSCAGLRELGIKDQPRKLLDMLGATRIDLPDGQVCCGFGGTFCIKYPDISTRMVTDKIDAASSTGAAHLVAGDLGCLMNMAGRAHRLKRPIKVWHIAELLAGLPADAEPIGGFPDSGLPDDDFTENES